MAVSPNEFGKSLVASGLMTADDVKTFWQSLPSGERPKDGSAFAESLVTAEKLTRFQAEEILAGSGTPLVLGEHVLTGRIGAGGMGQVFQARHRRMKRLVAIKFLPLSLSQDVDAVKRFEREVEVAAKLVHPNIVAAFDAGEIRGRHYLVMEYVEGDDLARVVAHEGPLPIDRAVDYIRQAAKGLAYAHENGVVHRDIKPANLLLDKKGIVKILDMGLARLDDAAIAKAQEGLTQSGQVMGTVDYMAPEQAFNTRGADARADIYSLGCTLYRLLTGKNLFHGETIVEKLMAHQTQPIPQLATQRSDVPAGLVRIFEKMVAKLPEERFQTMVEVEVALAALLSPSSSVPASSSSSNSKLNAFLHSITAPNAVATATKGKTTTPPVDGTSPTVSFVHPQLTTDPVSERSIQIAREDSDRALNRQRQWWKGAWVFRSIALAGGILGLVSLAIWGLSGRRDTNSLSEQREPAAGVASSLPSDYALQFDGVDDYVHVPTLNFTEAETITIEATVTPLAFKPSGWFQFAVQALPQGGRVGLITGGVNMQWVGLEIDRARSGAEFMTFERRSEMEVHAQRKNRPVRLACVLRPPPANSDLFVNGQLQAGKEGHVVQGDSYLLDQPAGLWMGGCLGAAGKLHGGINAQITDVRISRGERYQSDYALTTPLTADATTLALYRFDEGASDVLNDSSGHGHHGKIVGAKWVRRDGLASSAPPFAVAPFDAKQARANQEAWAKQVGEYALSFSDGSSVVIPSLDDAFDPAGPLTVECWVATPGKEDYRGQSNVVGFGASPFSLVISGSMAWDFRVYTNEPVLPASSGRYRYAGGGAAFGPRRYHLAGVRTERKIEIFVDGKRKTTSDILPVTLAKKNPGKDSFTIGGKLQNFVDFHGVIDEVQLSKAARYDQDFTPPQTFQADTDTLALYHFDEGQGDVLKDSSGNGHHGTIVGAKWVRVDVRAIALPVGQPPPTAGEK